MTKRVVETADFGKMVRRMVRAYGRRVAGSPETAPDVEQLAGLADIRAEVDAAIRETVAGLKEAGHSWADIGRVLGTSRQNAQQVYGRGL